MAEFHIASYRNPAGEPAIIGIVSEPEAPPVRRQDEEPMVWCPVCSTRLSERKCKLFCEKCGYYMSCADYY